MARRISLSRAARLIGVKRGMLQQEISLLDGEPDSRRRLQDWIEEFIERQAIPKHQLLCEAV